MTLTIGSQAPQPPVAGILGGIGLGAAGAVGGSVLGGAAGYFLSPARVSNDYLLIPLATAVIGLGVGGFLGAKIGADL